MSDCRVLIIDLVSIWIAKHRCTQKWHEMNLMQYSLSYWPLSDCCGIQFDRQYSVYMFMGPSTAELCAGLMCFVPCFIFFLSLYLCASHPFPPPTPHPTPLPHLWYNSLCNFWLLKVFHLEFHILSLVYFALPMVFSTTLILHFL